MMFLELSHKRLLAWQKATELVRLIYMCCSRLPAEEQYTLGSQIKRAAISVANNIAEGAARKTAAEKNRFYAIARSSLVEADTTLGICAEMNMIAQEDLNQFKDLLPEIFKLISGLIKANTVSRKWRVASRD